MPQVPTSFVPQVGVSGEGASVQFVAPGVAPMQNLAAEQQVELGRTTQSVGQTLWRIGQIMTDDINSARAKQADSQFLDAANEILRGQNGYMYSRGQDAEAQFQAAQDALAERAQAIQDSLDNNVQRQMFQQATARNLSNFRTQMYGHRNEQVIKWNATESAARSERYQGEAVNEYRSRGDNTVDRNNNPLGKFASNVKNAMDERVRSMRLAGFPEDSDAMRAAKAEVMDNIAKGVVGRLIQDDDFAGGIRYVDGIREQMSPAAYEQLRNTLVVNQERQAGLEMAESAVAGRGLSTVAGTAPFMNVVKTPARTTTVKEGIGDLETQARGGVIIEAQQGSEVVAPYDGVVAEVKTENGRTMVAIQLDNGDVAVISNLDPTGERATSLYAGMVVGRGETVGVMGNVPIQYSLTRDGENLPMDKVNSLDKDEIPRVPASEQEALAMGNRIENRTTREVYRARVREIYAERNEAKAQSYQAMYNEAVRLVREGQDIPPDILADLSPEDRKALTSPFATQDNWQELATAYESPGVVTLEWVGQRKGEFTEGTWNRLMAQASSGANQRAKADADAITMRLRDNGLDALAMPKKGSAEELDGMRLRANIQQTLDAMRAKGDVKQEDVDKVIDMAIMNYGRIMTEGWWDNIAVQKPIAAMSERELERFARTREEPGDYYGQRVIRVLDENNIPRFVPAIINVTMSDKTVVPITYWQKRRLDQEAGRELNEEELRKALEGNSRK